MKRVLLVNPFGLGDVLFSIPLLLAIKKSGVERLDVILGSRTAQLVKRFGCVDVIFSVSKDELKKKPIFSSLKYTARLLNTLRRNRYDTLVDLSLTREYAFWSQFFLGIRTRVGFDFKSRGFFLTDPIPLPDGFKDRHVMRYYEDLAGRLGISMDGVSLTWPRDPDEEASALKKASEAGLGPDRAFLAVSPGGGASWGQDAIFKRWSPEKFSLLSTRLSALWGMEGIAILGSSEEAMLAGRFLQACSVPAVDLTGKLTLGETAALIRRSRLFLGNDGGLLHVAKSVGVPTASIFGPVDHRVYGPYPRTERDAVVCYENLECRPCYKKFRYNAACRHRACLTELTVEEAARQIEHQPVARLWKVPYL